VLGGEAVTHHSTGKRTIPQEFDALRWR